MSMARGVPFEGFRCILRSPHLLPVSLAPESRLFLGLPVTAILILHAGGAMFCLCQAIMVTHMHADHHLGLPELLAMRRRAFTVLHDEGAAVAVRAHSLQHLCRNHA